MGTKLFVFNGQLPEVPFGRVEEVELSLGSKSKPTSELCKLVEVFWALEDAAPFPYRVDILDGNHILHRGKIEAGAKSGSWSVDRSPVSIPGLLPRIYVRVLAEGPATGIRIDLTFNGVDLGMMGWNDDPLEVGVD